MKIEIVHKERLTEHFSRWYLKLDKRDFRMVGYCLEALEGAGRHSTVWTPQKGLILEVSDDYVQEAEELIAHLNDYLSAQDSEFA